MLRNNYVMSPISILFCGGMYEIPIYKVPYVSMNAVTGSQYQVESFRYQFSRCLTRLMETLAKVTDGHTGYVLNRRKWPFFHNLFDLAIR